MNKHNSIVVSADLNFKLRQLSIDFKSTNSVQFLQEL